MYSNSRCLVTSARRTWKKEALFHYYCPESIQVKRPGSKIFPQFLIKYLKQETLNQTSTGSSLAF